ncbi:MAG: sulfite exporter TauE/SafE family protein [Bacteroidales bacterium]|nr:sulfite exporter TauE/SafE family protein [Bacteroidales bacterium]
MDWWIYILVVVIGVLAGFINTIAGSGSLLTLPLLIFLGLDPNTANGTNRLSIFMQSISAVSGFKKNKVFTFNEGAQFAIPATIGAIAGALIAVKTKPEVLNYIIASLLVGMLILLLFNPKKWLKPSENKEKKNKALMFILFLTTGVYAGFLHASVGFFWLAALVLGAGYDLVKANALKNFIVLLYIPITILIFAYNNQINYGLGLLLGAGSMIGARLAVVMSVKKGAPLIRYFLLVAILISAIKLIFF